MLNRYALLAAAGLLMLGCNQAQSNPADPASIPAPVQALSHASGIEINGSMDAPAGFRGFLGHYHDQAVPLYLLPDGQHVVIGSLYDAKGTDLTSGPYHAATAPKLDASLWTQLEKSHWIAEGSAQPKRIVYVFTDTECPYCHRLWEASQPYLKSGDVQIRNVIVAVIAPDSLGRGAAVLAAKDPYAALISHEQHFHNNSPIQPLKQIPEPIKQQIEQNEALMDQLQIEGTPTVLFKDAHGAIQMVPGMPSSSAMQAIFGG